MFGLSVKLPSAVDEAVRRGFCSMNSQLRSNQNSPMRDRSKTKKTYVLLPFVSFRIEGCVRLGLSKEFKWQFLILWCRNVLTVLPQKNSCPARARRKKHSWSLQQRTGMRVCKGSLLARLGGTRSDYRVGKGREEFPAMS